MPFDALAMAAATDEIRNALEGGRVQRILQPSAASIALAIYHGGHQHWLVLSADAQHARVQLSPERLAKGFPTPGPFVMLLRKYLDGARVTAVKQVPRERIFEVHSIGSEGDVRLIAEIMGKHSNVLLVSEEDVILGAVKSVPPQQSRVRPILPGRPYTRPPARGRDERYFAPGERVDPSQEWEIAVQLLSSLPPDTGAAQALIGLLPGCSPFLAEQIVLRAGRGVAATVGDISPADLVDAAAWFYRLPTDDPWRPCVFRDSRGRLDFAPFVPLGVDDVEETHSVSAAVDRVLGAAENRDPLLSQRRALIEEIRRAHTTAERKVRSLWEGLESSERAEEVMTQGQLLLAYKWAVEPGMAAFEVPDMEIIIPLDSALSVQENADRLFRRYRKLRDAAARLPALIEAAERDAERLEEMEAFARIAQTEADLRDLAAELHPESRPVQGKRAPVKRRGPARYRLAQFTATAGRNARENEEVTFRLASRDDVWLHARERTGAHVVLHGGQGAPDEILLAAASLAAYLSEGRSDTAVDVDVAAVRDVRKIPGGPPGRVTYRNFRTLRVKPDAAGWQPA